MHNAAKTPRLEESLEPLEFERLYAQHGEFVRALLARLLGPNEDSDDLAQEVFLVAFKKRGEAVITAPRAWLCRIAVNLATNARRRKRLRQALRLGFFQESIDRRTPEVLTEAREAARCTYRILDAISEKKRTVFILYEMLGMSGQEIAHTLGCPIKTVQSRLAFARREFVAAFARTADVGAGGRRD